MLVDVNANRLRGDVIPSKLFGLRSITDDAAVKLSNATAAARIWFIRPIILVCARDCVDMKGN